MLATSKNILGQCALIPKPTLTESNLPDQTGKVFLVTGSNTGIGKDLAGILYSANGTVYVAGRNTEKCAAAMEDIKKAHPESKGKIKALKLDLADLPTIKASAEEFLKQEQQLHVLWNNAGVMIPPSGSKTAQGYELQMGTNCYGHYVFTEHLKSVLLQTAASSPPNTVRVAWAGSLAIDTVAPTGGVHFTEDGSFKVESQMANYGASKVGNRYLAQNFAKEVKGKGIVSVCFNPGNLRTELQRHALAGSIKNAIGMPIKYAMLYPSRYGAYTELWCGLSPDLTTAHNGAYIAPWGRLSYNRTDVEQSMKSKEEGGTGVSDQFMDCVKKETKAYL